MAFGDQEDLSRMEKDVSPQGHGQFITGTLMSALMGHGYRENGVSHIQPIMEAWERFNGMARRYRSSNKAMEVGKTMEEVAYAKASELLRLKELSSSEVYQNARLYEAYRGLYIQDENVPEGEYGQAANIDGALVDISGEYTDPRNGETISGREYAERQALEVAMLARLEENNDILIADGEDPQPLPAKKFTEKMPWMGTTDIKVTMSERVLDENALKGIPPGWVVQVHHYNKMLREENERNGFDVKKYPNLMGIYQFCTAIMDGRFHEIQHDPDLEKEMARRAEAFAYCVKHGVPPNSSEMASVFYEYPVKRPEPEAIFVSEKLENTFAELLEKRGQIDKTIKELEGYKENIDRDLQKGLERVNRRAGSTTPKAVFINQGEQRGVTLLDYKSRVTNRTKLDEVGLNKTISIASSAKKSWESAQEILSDDTLTAEQKLERLEAAHKSLGDAVGELPPSKEALDLGAFKHKEKTESAPKVMLTNNKRIQQIYQREQQARLESIQGMEAQTPNAEAGEPATEAVAEKHEVDQQEKGIAEQATPEGNVVPAQANEPRYVSEPYEDLVEPEASHAPSEDMGQQNPAQQGMEEEKAPEVSEVEKAREHADSIGLPQQLPSF